MFVDTHCHLDDPKIINNIGNVVKEFENENVKIAISMGCDVNTSIICKNISENFTSVFFGAGIHPMDVKNAKDGDLDKIYDIAGSEKCVCIGEIGIDLFWDKSNVDEQKSYLQNLIDIAFNKKLPVSIHMRNSTLDTMTVLKNNKNKLVYGGSLHCYNGSKETLKEILNLGLCVGFGGTSTFKNANNILKIIPLVPDDRILTETDCPFLAPEPVRGSLNTPKNIPIILKKLAELRNQDEKELEKIIENNTKRVFNKIK